MSKQNSEPNPYFVLGKLMEKSVDFNKINEFVEQYVKIAENNGEKAGEVIMRIKNFTMELSDTLLSSCVNIQANLPKEKFDDPTSDRVTVKQAAEIFSITTATIRNWINDKNNPLPALNVGKRQTTVLLKDLKEYTFKLGKLK